MNNITLKVEKGIKRFRSDNYNYDFSLKTGFLKRWGSEKVNDPQWSEFGPEILDLEISTKCNGGCPYCYKSNTAKGKNMQFDTFKKIINNMPQYNGEYFLTQVAFGLGAEGVENPAIWDMCKYLRERNIIPNGTVANINYETAKKIAENFGAVAVSLHLNSFGINKCYDQVKMLSDLGMKQVNIHFVLAQETLDAAHRHLESVKNDPRLSGLRATVFLALKQKGRAEKDFNPVSQKAYNNLVSKMLDKGISLGMDSCSAIKTEFAFKQLCKAKKINDELLKICLMSIEPCESSLFSSYINVEGGFFPCSFTEGNKKWVSGIDTISMPFIDVWNSTRTNIFRSLLLKEGRKCLLYHI